MKKARDILKAHWGFSDFRGPQERIIETVLSGRDVLALMPTGGGKSLCYQVPGLVLPGITIVVSPLISLIQDQVESLASVGIQAVHFGAGTKAFEAQRMFDNLIEERIKFLYLSPEKLKSPSTLERLKHLNVNLVAIDEAHCVSQWGHDFRPSFLEISSLRSIFPKVPFLALTATATPAVQKDLLKSLNMEEATVFKTASRRENIAIRVIDKANPFFQLERALRAEAKASCIVYAGTRKNVQFLYALLQDKGLSVSRYHGGMASESRKKALKSWMENKTQVMVATNAFGMGIDKEDVRLVVHYDIPLSLEHYTQEFGRAGRDGNPAHALLIKGPSSVRDREEFLKATMLNPNEVYLVYQKLCEQYFIALGSLNEEAFPFDFNAFCKTYGFPSLKAYQALKTLEQESLLNWEEFGTALAEIKIQEKGEALRLRLQRRDPDAKVLDHLMRQHGGITEMKVRFSELKLANTLGWTKSAVKTSLVRLHKDQVISYQAGGRMTKLRFTMPREDQRIRRMLEQNISLRNQNRIDLFKVMQQYLDLKEGCRSQFLETYFGDSSTEACRKCDLCLKRKQMEDPHGISRAQGQISSSKATDKSLKESLLEELKAAQELSIQEIALRMPQVDEQMLIKSLEELVDAKTIELNLRHNFQII